MRIFSSSGWPPSSTTIAVISLVSEAMGSTADEFLSYRILPLRGSTTSATLERSASGSGIRFRPAASPSEPPAMVGSSDARGAKLSLPASDTVRAPTPALPVPSSCGRAEADRRCSWATAAMADSTRFRCAAASCPLPERAPVVVATRTGLRAALVAGFFLASNCALLLPILVVLAADAALTATALLVFALALREAPPRVAEPAAFVAAAVLRVLLEAALALRDAPALPLTPAEGFWAGAA